MSYDYGSLEMKEKRLQSIVIPECLSVVVSNGYDAADVAQYAT